MKLNVFAFLSLLFFVSSCAGGQSYEIEEFSNISYTDPSQGLDSLRMLNLVQPKGASGVPLLIWIGGGAWSYVDRHMEMDLARKVAEEGITVASIGHRLSSAVWRDPKLSEGVQHPAHVQDLALAVKWLVDNVADYGYSEEQIFVGGYSSGAHLAALIALDVSYLEQLGIPGDIFKGVLPISGAYDIHDYHRVLGSGSRPELAVQHVEAVFGPPKGFDAASPVNYLDGLRAPMLIISDGDLHNYTRLFEDRIRETDFREIQVMYAHEFSHSDLWRDMSNNAQSDYRRAMVRFIERCVSQ